MDGKVYNASEKLNQQIRGGGHSPASLRWYCDIASQWHFMANKSAELAVPPAGQTSLWALDGRLAILITSGAKTTGWLNSFNSVDFIFRTYLNYEMHKIHSWFIGFSIC